MNQDLNNSKPLSEDQRRFVNATVLASKYKVSEAYVGQILNGDKAANSATAKKILDDALAIVEAYNMTPAPNPQ